VTGRSDKAAARAVLMRILSVEPEYRPDPSVFPPSFIAEVNGLREELTRTPTTELQLTIEPTGIGIVVGGRPMGTAPVTVHLPPSLYRLEGMWGYKGLTRLVDVGVPPQPPLKLVLRKEVEGSIAPDAGPCIFPAPSREAALARFAALVKVRLVYSIRSQTSGNTQSLVAEEFDASTGRVVQQKRETVSPHDVVSQTAGRLALSLAVPAEPQATPNTPTSAVNNGLRTWAYVTGAVGLATTTAGLLLYFKGNSQTQKLYSQYAEGNNVFPPGSESAFQSQNDTAKTNKTIGSALVGVGVAALGTGVALFFISASGGQPPPVVVGTYLQPAGGGTVVSGQF
jgi:hypothetical protein